MNDTLPAIELKILGPTELRLPGGSESSVVRQPKQLALLAWLALSTADGYRRRDQIVALFWPELDQESARAQLRKALFGLRESLGADAVLGRGEGEVRLDPSLLWCDAVALLKESRPEVALGLYRGELLNGLYPEGVAQEFHDWLAEQRRVLRERAAVCAWDCSRLEDERGDRRAAVLLARRALELSPDDEDGVRRLISLLDRHGDRAGALRAYGDWVKRLHAEYGVEPAPETRKLARKVQAARKGESHETPPTPLSPVSLPLPRDPAEPGGPAMKRPLAPTLVAAALLVAAGLAAGRFSARAVARVPPNSVAVLPMRAIGDARVATEAERVTEELASALASQRALELRSTTRARDAIGERGDMDGLGRRLGVAWLVDGAVQQRSRLRVTLRLIRARDAMTVWAGTFDAADSGLVVDAQHLAAAAAQAIAERLTDPDSTPSRARP